MADSSTIAAGTAADVVRDLKSPGVVRVEALAKVMTLKDRIIIFIGVFLVAYAYGLDGTIRGTLQPTATSSMGSHSLTSTVNVIRAVIGAGIQPAAGKMADVFGRVELLLISCFFYVLGTIIEAVAPDVVTLAAGTGVYTIGYTMVILLVEVIIADITSTRSRVFFSYVPALPFIINTWAGGSIVASVLKTATWRWGYGMWCIIYPVCTLPLIIQLVIVGRRARRQGLLDNYKSSFQLLGAKNFALELFWLLDVVGILLLVATFALILVPFTLAEEAGGQAQWATARVLAPLVVGVACVPVFVFWQLRAPHPLIPFRLMKDRSVWSPCMIAVMLNFAWTMQGDFLYTVLVVAFDFSVADATRISSLYSFTSVIVGPLLGLIVIKVRRLKWFIVAGTSLFMVAFGLLIHYRGSTSPGDGRAGVIGAQVVLGFAGGMFPYPAQASLQVTLQHEHLAVMTGTYLAMYNIGSALGNTVSGAIWRQTLPGYLEKNVQDQSVAASAFSEPLNIIAQYPMGTPERQGIIASYRQTQRLLTITGICLCVPLIGFAAALRNPRLNHDQTLAKESDDESELGDRAASETSPTKGVNENPVRAVSE
ncbi:major facilitator superfamily domain-containing protein [Emericellopsis atlantica]|uniref:Major facilitator superfamily domain-containing protein n=1 Tax=Emericellopsis atlantica TaxID=2614577 RepID=A0A9P7ZH90_9HYPO|nr:major facilitator superfamily domain-containing protein [Emericellopsis atlantica]KAG9251642.1 major facilitator superfamily domain-containing protein [Emericellopsis atlantica]